MSLINRVLRDLSSRQSKPADVLAGVQVGPVSPRRRRSWRRLAAFAALIAVFTTVFWLLARPPSPPDSAVLARPAGPVLPRFQLDESLSDPAPLRAVPRPLPPRPAQLRPESQLAAAPAPPATRPRRAPAPSAESPARAAEPPAPAGAAPEVASASPAENAAATSAPAEVPAAPVAAPAAPVQAPTAPPAAAAAPASVSAAPATAPLARPRDIRASQARFAEAQRTLQAGDRSSAERQLRDAVELDPANHAAREALATLLLNDDRYVEALVVLEEGLLLAPDRAAFRRLAARVDLARGHPALALQRLDANRPPVVTDPEYHGLLASAYQRLSRHDEAAALYQSLTQTQPGEPHWWAGFGLSRDALGDRPGALAAFAQARALGRLDPRVLDHINRRTTALAGP